MKFAHLESIGSLAIVGSTGLVGQELLSLLSDHKIKFPKMKRLASINSQYDGDEDEIVEALTEQSFEGVDVAIFSVPNEVTKRFVPIAQAAGCTVIDDSSVFRMEKDVPLIVPEVNGNTLRDFQGTLISTPNCTTTPLVQVLSPLRELGLERVVVSTYQSVSGAGRDAYRELSEQAISLLNGEGVSPKVFPHQIAFNCLPMIGSELQTGSSEEEEKVVRETRKILDEDELKVTCTAVRVPTFCGHCLSVNIEFSEKFNSVEEIRELLDKTPGIKILDKAASHIYPTNMECIGGDLTLVGRVRRDFSVPSGINLWIACDNLRKGSALNILQILDMLYKYRMMA